MKKSIFVVAALSLIVLFAGKLESKEKKVSKKEEPTVTRRRGPSSRQASFAGLKLTEEQQAKVKKIMANARQKIVDEVLTADQKKQLEDGKKKREEKRAEFIKKFDKNGDGKLDGDERKALKESFTKGKRTRKEK